MYLAKKKVLSVLFSLHSYVVFVSNIPFPPKNDIQCKSLVNKIPTSFIFQPYTNQYFLHETYFLM